MFMRDQIEDLFSAEALAKVARPGGYECENAFDSITGKSMYLEDPDVPLGLAAHIIGAHAQARASVATGWEATLMGLAQDLWARCSALEERQAADK